MELTRVGIYLHQEIHIEMRQQHLLLCRFIHSHFYIFYFCHLLMKEVHSLLYLLTERSLVGKYYN